MRWDYLLVLKCTVEVSELIIYFTPHFAGNVITYIEANVSLVILEIGISDLFFDKLQCSNTLCRHYLAILVSGGGHCIKSIYVPRRTLRGIVENDIRKLIRIQLCYKQHVCTVPLLYVWTNKWNSIEFCLVTIIFVPASWYLKLILNYLHFNNYWPSHNGKWPMTISIVYLLPRCYNLWFMRCCIKMRDSPKQWDICGCNDIVFKYQYTFSLIEAISEWYTNSPRWFVYLFFKRESWYALLIHDWYS